MTTSPFLSSLAPSIPLFGSYFPAWLVCLFAAIVLTLMTRALLVVTGIDDILRWRVPVYMSMSLAFTYLSLMVFFGR
ncbi:YtcA family lipoprotein [Stappia sp.]|uniref:YtcA family lipoprotein n=1 Tax=Stappia sp. TaxID=1870903 RepID=UPI003A98F74D